MDYSSHYGRSRYLKGRLELEKSGLKTHQIIIIKLLLLESILA